jgi:hypothetical protein
VNPAHAGKRILDPTKYTDMFCLVVAARNEILHTDAEEEPGIRLPFFSFGLYLGGKGGLQACNRSVEATDARVGGKLVVG